MQPGDEITTSMTKSGNTWTVTGSWNGQETTLSVNTGTEFFNWPNATLEVYNIDNCNQFAAGPMTISAMEMLDTNGGPIDMTWQVSGNGVACNTTLNVENPQTITIQEDN